MEWLVPAAEPADLLPIARAEVRRILEAALDGVWIDGEEATRLLQLSFPGDVAALLAVAGELRTRHKGTTVTYSPKVFLPVTNLCLDRCAYCTFRADPEDAKAWTMLPEEIRAVCETGRQQGCIEALLCLGDKPERSFPTYRQTLAVLGHTTTIAYVRQASELALASGLLPHTNAGVMTLDEMASLKPVNVSLGLMLENVSPRLRAKGEAHWHAPDKDPAKRLAMMEAAGELQIPFTTGLLLGIGETSAEVAESLAAIRDLHRRHGHIQEVILQNFRAKPTTKMARHPEPENVEVAKTIAVARLMMPEMNLQAPPNLSPRDHRLLLRAGINDWGGISPVTPDYVNPEAPWPHVAALAATCAEAGFDLRPRLPIYAEYLDRPGFLDEALRPAVLACQQAHGVAPC